MLSRAFTTQPRRSFKYDGEQTNKSKLLSGSIHEYDDCIVGIADDLPLNSCVELGGVQMTMKEVLRSSVGVMGESRIGMTEKVVLLKANMFAVKRFRKVTVRRREFGRRVEKLAQVCNQCEYLVPTVAYLYAKRIKFVLCDYYPMGSLADILAGARKQCHTAFKWDQRLKIMIHIARAIAFIHAQCPVNERSLQLNIHGNIKSSNVMINIDFSACLSDYGFTQLAEFDVEVSDSPLQQKPSTTPSQTEDYMYCEELSQKSDIYNFGVILMDLLGGSRFLGFYKCILRRKEEIKEGRVEFFEFDVEGKELKQASQVFEIALACINSLPEARPSIEQILLFLGKF